MEHFLGRRIEVSSRVSNRGSTRFYATIDGEAMLSARGAVRTWSTRPAALEAAKLFVHRFSPSVYRGAFR